MAQLDIQHNKDEGRAAFGDLVECDPKRLIKTLIQAHGLIDIARSEDSIEIIMTGDGAEICGTKGASQTAIGYKMIDARAMDPTNLSCNLTVDISVFQWTAIYHIVMHSRQTTILSLVFLSATIKK